jgi:hypothetical protein
MKWSSGPFELTADVESLHLNLHEQKGAVRQTWLEGLVAFG